MVAVWVWQGKVGGRRGTDDFPQKGSYEEVSDCHVRIREHV